MDHFTWRLAAILGALISTSALMGASLYEESVLDLVWPRKPDVVRPIEGGANRKLFWDPADLIAIITLVVATWAAWPVTCVWRITEFSLKSVIRHTHTGSTSMDLVERE